MKKIIIFCLIIFTIISFYPSTIFAEVSAEEVKNEGYNRGYEAGRNQALINNINNKYIPYEQIQKPTKTKVWDDYSEYLKDKYQYRNDFYDGYMAGFKDGYNDYIGIGAPGSPGGGSQPINYSADYGAFFGTVFGEIAGIKDFEAGKSPNYLRELPKDSEITTTFDLKKLASIDRTYFIREFKSNFRKGYEDAYYNAHYGLKRDSIEAGRNDGSYFGEIVGSIFGAKDYFEGRTLDHQRNMPSDSIIKSEYSLNRDNEEYTKGFIEGFKNAYREAYITSFREARNNVKELEVSFAYENGYVVGEARGIEQGRIDYVNRKTNDWMRSRPSASAIIHDYKLMYQGQRYMEDFVNGFWEGYSKGYTDTYKELSQEDAINKVTSLVVPLDGGRFQSSDSSLIVEIDRGTYYRENILNIDVVSSYNRFDNKYIFASNSYRISVVNPSGEFNPDKKILISFEYYGDNRGGIYIQRNDKWEYLNSKIEDNRISTSVHPSLLSGNGSIFAVLVDKEMINFYDIRGHWAKNEIETLVRKGIINGYPDKTFRPDNYITRAEFLVLLSRAYQWNLPADTNNLSLFKDRNTFNAFSEKQISYALSHGYISGYPDNYFRPNNNITYKEVEIIMRRILKNSNFTWDSIANKIIYDKKVRSNSFDSMNNNITRAEFSYLLYDLIK